MTSQCSASQEVLDWIDSDFAGCGTLSLNMPGCCGNLLTSSDNETCRTFTVESAYCESQVISASCANFEPDVNDTITFDINVTYPNASETCCQKCKCYGDPLCEAFDGTRDQFIECDARDNTTCKMKQSICRKQYDHAGNRCKWLKGNAHYDWVSNLVSGSPCQADYNVSGYMNIPMVDVDDLVMNTRIGERGVIMDFIITLPGDDEPYTLNSDDCFNYDPRDVGTDGAAEAWQLPSTSSAIPSEWYVSTPNDVEIRWHVGNKSLGLYAEIICTKAVDAVRTRLDIENVTDTQNRTDGEGFCFSGVIDRGDQSGTNVDNPELHVNCLGIQLTDLANTCKALADDSCYDRVIDGWQQYWCETAELSNTQASSGSSSYEEMVSTCLSDIREGTSEEQSQTWIKYACQMNSQEEYGSSSQDSYVDECMNKLEEFGWWDWRQTYVGIIPHQWTVSETCVTDLSAFTDIPENETCLSGLMVETYQDEEWVPVFYFPPESPPCDGSSLVATGVDYPELFKYQIRLRQCGLEASCLVAEEGTECKPIMQITADLIFAGESCSSTGNDVGTTGSSANCSICTQNLLASPTVCGSTDEFYVGTCEQCCETNNYVNGQENATCRYVETLNAFCEQTESQNTQYCKNIQKESYNTTMTVSFTPPSTGFDSDCCNSCALWGDPFGQSFDGTREKFIICDARDDSCWMQEDICSSLVDHAGNPCIWNETVANEIGSHRGNIGAYGSPCLPDWEKSGEDEVILYSVEEPTFQLSFYTGERSVLTKLLLTTPNGTYTLEPKTCFSDNPADGWTTVSGVDAEDALQLTYTAPGEDGYGDLEAVWSVLEPWMGIFFRVTCIATEAITSDYVGGYRFNVEHMIDTNINRTTAGGYCETGDLYKYAGSYTNSSNAIECEVEDLTAEVRACKAFWTGSCTSEQVDIGISKWCSTANQPDSVDDCVSSISKSSSAKTAAAWTKAVCTALLPLKPSTDSDDDFLLECEDLADTEGYYAIVLNYGSAGERDKVSSYCASSVDEYSTRDDYDACTMGVSVQYEGSDGWTEVFFIPSTLLPCNNQLVIPAYESKYAPLFLYPVRFEQCDLDNSEDGCLASENVEASCMANFGYNISVSFNYNDLGCSESS